MSPLKRFLYSILTVIMLLFCFVGCVEADKYNREQFYGVVRFSEECERLVVYIQGIGDVEIPDNEGICACFDGHGPNEDKSYRLKDGDLIKINFKYEKSWDDHGVAIMESYPARFDRKAGLIEALREGIGFEKVDSGYVFSFPSSDQTVDMAVGDTVYFVLHGGYNGRAYKKLCAEGMITETRDGIITVALTIHDEENKFLENYPSMSIERSWEE